MHLVLGDGERPPFRPEEFDAYAAALVLVLAAGLAVRIPAEEAMP